MLASMEEQDKRHEAATERVSLTLHVDVTPNRTHMQQLAQPGHSLSLCSSHSEHCVGPCRPDTVYLFTKEAFGWPPRPT